MKRCEFIRVGLLLLLITLMVGCVVEGTVAGPKPERAVASNGKGAGQVWPAGFGVSNQAPLYNPRGSVKRGLVDGADHTLQLGIKTFKINLSRGALPGYFYHLDPAKTAKLKTMTEMIKLAEYQQVIRMPFDTIFLDADNIGTKGRTTDYWRFERTPIQPVDEAQIYAETFELAKYLLGEFKGTSKTFVIQNHEGDWHALPESPSCPHTICLDQVPTVIGLKNFEIYWLTRQRAVEDARSAVKSSAEVYHMCEVVRVAQYYDEHAAGLSTKAGTSLARDVLPKVGCDLVGYSAHDTTLRDDGGASLRGAVELLRQVSRASPTFGRKHVVISEIAVPENYPKFKPKTARVAAEIKRYLKQGMPWVLYWQLYDNGKKADGQYMGNWIVRPDGSLTLMANAILGKTPPGDGDDPNKSGEGAGCVDKQLVSTAAPVPPGVDPAIAAMYSQVLGGNWPANYMPGALYLTKLYYKGYTLQSLRYDLVKEPAVRAAVNVLYQAYLNRNIADSDYLNVKDHLGKKGTLRQIELMIVASPECATK